MLHMELITNHDKFFIIPIFLLFLLINIPGFLFIPIVIFYFAMLSRDLYSTLQDKEMIKHESAPLLVKLCKKFSPVLAGLIMSFMEIMLLVIFATIFGSVLQQDIFYWLGAMMTFMGIIHMNCWISNEKFIQNKRDNLNTRSF